MNKERIVEISKAGVLFALHAGELCLDTAQFRKFKKLLLDHWHKDVEPRLRHELQASSDESADDDPCSIGNRK